MRQVFVKEKRANGNSELFAAEVLSESLGKLRVVIQGRTGIKEVDAADTVPMAAVAGQPITNFQSGSPMIPKQYPGRGSLFHMING